MRIYDEFTSKVRSASHTNSLSTFTEKLSAKMGIISIGGKKEDRANITKIIKGNDDAILNLLRNETQLIILMMRELIETKRESGNDEFSGIDAHIENLIERGHDDRF